MIKDKYVRVITIDSVYEGNNIEINSQLEKD
jgi:hypothetical protein